MFCANSLKKMDNIDRERMVKILGELPSEWTIKQTISHLQAVRFKTVKSFVNRDTKLMPIYLLDKSQFVPIGSIFRDDDDLNNQYILIQLNKDYKLFAYLINQKGNRWCNDGMSINQCDDKSGVFANQLPNHFSIYIED
jgi:hypothetical protein